jgi:hypothetical protein
VPSDVRSQGWENALLVPLPHGTEVTTRVERLCDGRRVPQGVVGRVVRARGGGFDVLFAGLGEVWYARGELLPRKPGQLHFALRREATWQALRRCVVLEAVVGSRAWGLSDADSDTDVRGVFVLPLPWRFGLESPPTDLVSADGSESHWSFEKAVGQALRADPNTLELLFLPSARATDVIGQWLLDERQAFVSRNIFGSFGRYALSQLGKLTRAQRLAEHQERVLEWLREEPAPALDEVARRLAAISPRAAPTPEDGILAAKAYVKQLYGSLADQGLVSSNDFAALTAYARSGGRRPEEARELRPKNAYNLVRLISLATEWLRTGQPHFQATGSLRERLLSIKRGQVPLAEVLRDAEALAPELERARDASPLPEEPDYRRAEVLLRRVGLEVAARYVGRQPGPLGAEAPEPPSPPSGG